jgi:hypothetical protein
MLFTFFPKKKHIIFFEHMIYLHLNSPDSIIYIKNAARHKRESVVKDKRMYVFDVIFYNQRK